MTLHPVHHVASVAVASCNGVLYINIRDVFQKLDAVEQVIIGTVAPVVSYSCIDVSEESHWLVSLTCCHIESPPLASGDVWSDDNISLLRPNDWIPLSAVSYRFFQIFKDSSYSCTPAIDPSSVRPSVHKYTQGILSVRIEVAGFDNPCMHIIIANTREMNLGDLLP